MPPTRLVAGGPQHLFGGPALGLGGNQDLGGGAPDRSSHPVGQHPSQDAADRAEGFGDQRQRRGRPLVGGERDEAPPGERQHRTEQKQPRCRLGPVDHQILTRRPHRRAATAVMIAAPRHLRLSDEAAEITGRPLVSGCTGDRQHPLRRHPAPDFSTRSSRPVRLPHRGCGLLGRGGAVSPASTFSTTFLTVL